jgi:hypothetical protein
VVNFTPQAALPSGKKNQYPLNMRLSGHQRWFGYFEEEQHLLLPTGFEPRIVQPVSKSHTKIKTNFNVGSGVSATTESHFILEI